MKTAKLAGNAWSKTLPRPPQDLSKTGGLKKACGVAVGCLRSHCLNHSTWLCFGKTEYRSYVLPLPFLPRLHCLMELRGQVLFSVVIAPGVSGGTAGPPAVTGLLFFLHHLSSLTVSMVVLKLAAMRLQALTTTPETSTPKAAQ